MYCVILGGSDFALDLASFMQQRESSKVVLVLHDKEKAIDASESIHAIVVNSDPTDTKTLDGLELESCDVFVAATRKENANVLAALYAKEKGAKEVFVKVDSTETKNLMKKLNIMLIDTEEVAARAIELMISMPAVSDLVNTGIGQFDIFELLASSTKAAGKKIADVKNDDFACLATYHKGEYCFDKDSKIEGHDTLIILTKSGSSKEVLKKIKSKSW